MHIPFSVLEERDGPVSFMPQSGRVESPSGALWVTRPNLLYHPPLTYMPLVTVVVCVRSSIITLKPRRWSMGPGAGPSPWKLLLDRDQYDFKAPTYPSLYKLSQQRNLIAGVKI